MARIRELVEVQGAKLIVIDSGASLASLREVNDEEFDGHLEALRFCKTFPGWDAPDAVAVTDKIAQTYMRAIELEARNFGGNLRRAADYIFERTQAYAQSPDRQKFTQSG